MSAPESPASELSSKLQWLMLLRVVLVTIFLGSSLILNPTVDFSLGNPERRWQIWLICGTYGLTITYALIFRRLKSGHRRFAAFQLGADLALSTVVVQVTGGTESVFMFLNTLVILSGAVVLGRRAALYLLVPATALLVLAVTREATGWLRSAGPSNDAELFGTYLSAITHLSAMFLVALLAGYLSEQVRTTGQELRSASADLDALRVLNEHIIDSIKSGILSHDLDGWVTLVNPTGARLLGVAPDEARRRRVADLVPDLPQGAAERWESHLPERDGQPPRVLGLARSPLFDGQARQTGWIVVFQDLTRVRALEESVRRNERLAAVGELAAGLAHELRNPLAGISGSFQMLQQGTQDPLQVRLMAIILREIDRLDALIDDFLRFARPTPPRFASVYLNEVVAEVLEGFRQRADLPTLTYTSAVEPEVHLEADPAQVRQMLLNLVLNAAQASAPGSRVVVGARLDGVGELVSIYVMDQGVGMPPDVLSRLFNPFFTTRPEGTGLGLAQVHRFVQDHNGTLTVDSTPGLGSTFTLRLPLCQPTSEGS